MAQQVVGARGGGEAATGESGGRPAATLEEARSAAMSAARRGKRRRLNRNEYEVSGRGVGCALRGCVRRCCWPLCARCWCGDVLSGV
jgi:hypothetical protein